jgi:hypothetical protein
MPFCPNCGYEYLDGIKFCGDCGAALVPFLRADDTPRINNFELVYKSNSRIEAEMIVSNLESAGFEVQMLDQIDKVYPQPINIWGVAHIFVRIDQVEDAKEFLDDMMRKQPPNDEEEDGK